MYDEASYYYAFNPGAQFQQDKPRASKYNRKQSLLERPTANVSSPAHLADIYSDNISYRKRFRLMVA